MYAKFWKRGFDFLLSAAALLVLSPLLLLLTILVAIKMKGNPFFTQLRPGWQEKRFKLIKFRSMTNARDKNGELLSDDERLTRFGRLLRATSLDELPELLNIVKGDMALVGPRPLLVEYLPYYTEEERHRHDARPGLTGLAQVNGRNAISWDEKLRLDIEYVNHITLARDFGILLKTVGKTLKRSDIQVGSGLKAGKFIDQRIARMEGRELEQRDEQSKH